MIDGASASSSPPRDRKRRRERVASDTGALACYVIVAEGAVASVALGRWSLQRSCTVKDDERKGFAKTWPAHSAGKATGYIVWIIGKLFVLAETLQ